MIVVDTSALMAIVGNEANASAVRLCLAATDVALISAGTLTEALIVGLGRNVQAEIVEMVQTFGLEVVPVTREQATAAAGAYEQWGKGRHPAGLNICDCFSYVLAVERGCPLLFIGNDFSRTDVRSALHEFAPRIGERT